MASWGRTVAVHAGGPVGDHDVGGERDVGPEGVGGGVVVSFVLERPLAVPWGVRGAEDGEGGAGASGRREPHHAARVLQVREGLGAREKLLAPRRILRVSVVEVIAELLVERRVQRQVVVPRHHQLALEVRPLEPLHLLGELGSTRGESGQFDRSCHLVDFPRFCLDYDRQAVNADRTDIGWRPAGDRTYLSVAPHVGQVAAVDEHVALGERDGAVVRVRYADEACPACSRRGAGIPRDRLLPGVVVGHRIGGGYRVSEPCRFLTIGTTLGSQGWGGGGGGSGLAIHSSCLGAGSQRVVERRHFSLFIYMWFFFSPSSPALSHPPSRLFVIQFGGT